MSNLLIQEPPLQVLPSLAVNIGLNEAIVLQQIHYWQSMRKNLRDGRYWVYNSVTQWEEQFPFWSYSTIRRALASLKELGVVDTANYNKDRRDKTLWYTINYNHAKMSTMGEGSGVEQMQDANMTFARCQNGITQDAKMSQPLPETTTETTSDTTKEREPALSNDNVATPEQLDTLFNQSSDTRRKFEMSFDWEPDRNMVCDRLRHTRVPVPTSDQLTNFICEFRNHFEAQSMRQTEHQWIAKLVQWIKRDNVNQSERPKSKQRQPDNFGQIDYRAGAEEMGFEVI